MQVTEQPIRSTRWTIRRYKNDQAFEAGDHYSESIVDGNVLLNEGIAELHDLLTGAGGTAYSQANSWIGVGDSATAESAAQTGLQAPTNKLYKQVEVGYPTFASQVSTWRAIFGSAEANFGWQEFTVANGNSDASVNLNRKTSDQGTKTAGQTWTIDLQITWS